MKETGAGNPTEVTPPIDDPEQRELSEALDELESILERPLGDQDALVERLEHDYPSHATAIRKRVAFARSPADDDEPWPEAFGPFRVLAELGAGGMGRVYLAERTNPRQRVAIKVMRPGWYGPEAQRRFRREQQAVASLNDDRIAKLHGTDTTVQGQQYFVMEYVAGSPITRYCDEHQLTVDARARLTRKICDAVHYAHQRGVIHRDLKPSNILVAGSPDEPRPKIIDFGLARFTEDADHSVSLDTDGDSPVGTPEFMSPEQFVPAAGTDTRTDVYSLGVMLYQLLAGDLPFRSDKPARGRFADLEQQILTRDPERPSTRLARSGRSVPYAQRRAVVELDWVVLKAMHKEPDRRYASAEAFARDLGNYLEGRPLDAGPPGLGYRARKFFARYWGRLAMAAAALATTLGTLTVFALQQRAEAARASFDAARLAAERGNWTDAIAHYERAAELRYPDDIAIAIGKVEAYQSNRQRAKALDSLAGLTARDDLGLHGARVMLLHAGLDSNWVKDPKKNLDEVREALAIDDTARERGETPRLTTAERCYAEALLADDADCALAFAKKGVAVDPSHRRLNDIYSVLLLCTGRIDEAAIHAEVLRTAYPDDLFGMEYQALMLAFLGRPGGPSSIPSDIDKRQREWIETASDMGAVLRQMRAAANDNGNLMRIALTWAGFVAKHPAILESPEFGGTLPPVIARGYRLTISAIPKLPFSRESALADLAMAGEIMCEGTWLVFRAYLEMSAKDFQGALATLEQASSMRSAFYDKKAILLAKLLAQLGYLIDHPDHPTRSAWEKDATETIHALLDEPGLARGDLETLSHATVVTHDSRAMLEVTGTFRRRFPADVDAGYYHASALRKIGALEAAQGEAKWVLEQDSRHRDAGKLLEVIEAALKARGR